MVIASRLARKILECDKVAFHRAVQAALFTPVQVGGRGRGRCTHIRPIQLVALGVYFSVKGVWPTYAIQASGFIERQTIDDLLTEFAGGFPILALSPEHILGEIRFMRDLRLEKHVPRKTALFIACFDIQKIYERLVKRTRDMGCAKLADELEGRVATK